MPPKKDAPVKKPVAPPAKPAAKPAAAKPAAPAAKPKVQDTAPAPPSAPEKPKEPPIDLSKVVVSEARHGMGEGERHQAFVASTGKWVAWCKEMAARLITLF